MKRKNVIVDTSFEFALLIIEYAEVLEEKAKSFPPQNRD